MGATWPWKEIILNDKIILKTKNVHLKPFWRYTGVGIGVFKNLSGSHLMPDRAEVVLTS